MNKRKWFLATIGCLIGAMVVIQMRSYDTVAALIARDPEASVEGFATPEEVFQQIYTLKLANESLKEDILALEEQLGQYSDQTSAYDTLVAEIEKNEALLGMKPIVGPGLIVTIDVPLSVEELVDFTNEWWSAGAEALSVNGIRLTDETDGFYPINDWALLHGTVLEAPYTFAAIGDATVMETVLRQPGSVANRLEDQLKTTLLYSPQDVIRMD